MLLLRDNSVSDMWKLVFLIMLSVGVQANTIKHRDYFDLSAEVLCMENATEYRMDDMKAAISTFKECMHGLLDVEVIVREIEEATSTKAFEGVFKKYCAKAPQVKACIMAVITGLTPCLPVDLPANAKNVYSNVIDFACYNEGARLTSFFKEGGPKCIEEKHSEFDICGQMISKMRSSTIMSVTEQERCTLGGQYTACAVTAMKSCSNPTPGKLAEELRQVYFTSLNCPEVKEQEQRTFTRLG